MSSVDGSCSFGFPYTPYPEQLRLMKALYECIESASIGCFESPTGTGKSLSSICASFTWLLKEEERVLGKLEEDQSSLEKVGCQANDDWLADFLAPASSNNLKSNEKNTNAKQASKIKYTAMLQRISKAGEVVKYSRDFFQFQRRQVTLPSDTRAPLQTDRNEEAEEIDEFELQDYESGDDGGSGDALHRISQKRGKGHSGASDSDGDSGSDSSGGEGSSAPKGVHGKTARKKPSPMEILELPQIIYCSRTHSQLSQFIAEIKKTPFFTAKTADGAAPAIRCITLGSRKTMCINEDVSRLHSESSMTEMCLEMAKKSSSKKTGDVMRAASLV
jgi:chromosome transmission fidelity protein 1